MQIDNAIAAIASIAAIAAISTITSIAAIVFKFVVCSYWLLAIRVLGASRFILCFSGCD